jgi:hypothetical protein
MYLYIRSLTCVPVLKMTHNWVFKNVADCSLKIAGFWRYEGDGTKMCLNRCWKHRKNI